MVQGSLDLPGEVLCVEEESLYPALHRMEEAGLIRAKWIAKGPGRRVRVYDLTAQRPNNPQRKRFVAQPSRTASSAS